MTDSPRKKTFLADLLSLLAIPGFLPFFLFRTIKSGSGWIAGTLMMPVLVYKFSATPPTMGVANLLLGLPFIVLGPYLGAMADRKSPVAFMTVGAIYRAVLLAALAFAPNVYIFIAILFFNAVGSSASVAEPIVLRRLLNDDQIVTATSVNMLMDQSTKLVAPLIGVGLLFFGTEQDGFLAIAAMSLMTAACAIMLGRTIGWQNAAHEPRKKRKSSLAALREIVRDYPRVKATVVMAIGTTITMGMHAAVLLFLMKEQHLPEGAYGLHMSCTAAGAIVCSLTLKKWMGTRDPVRFMTGCAVGFFATILGTGVWGLSEIPLTLFGLGTIWVISGYFFAGKMICYVVLLQTASPKEHVGLVMASSQSLMLMILEVTPLIGLAITHYHTAALAYVVSAVLGLLMLLPRSAHPPQLAVQD